MTTSLQAELDAIIEQAAREFARMWRLVDDQGRVWCSTDDCQHLALMPSLKCPQCLTDAWRRLGIVEPRCVNREQKPVKEKANVG